ncbi:MAG: hypothetical protein AAGF47_11080 [Planctomycetota bacterium]
MTANLGDFRRLTQMLGRRLYLSADRHEWDRYLDDLSTIVWLGDVAQGRGMMIQQLVNIAIQSRAQRHVCGDLVAGRLPPDVLDELAAIIAAAPEPVFADVLPAERILLTAFLDEMHLEIGRPDPEATEGLLGFASFFAEEGEDVMEIEDIDLDSLPSLSEIEALIDALWPEVERLAMRPLSARWRDREAYEAVGQEWPKTAGLAAMFIGGLSKADGSVQQFSLSRDGLLAMLAIERFRRDEDRLPTGLGELVPEYLQRVTPDPLGAGEPLVYRTDGSDLGYTLYSVAFDGQDDGGVVGENGFRGLHKPVEGIDFVFTRPVD